MVVASPVAPHSHSGSSVCVVKQRQVGCCTMRFPLSRSSIHRRAALCGNDNNNTLPCNGRMSMQAARGGQLPGCGDVCDQQSSLPAAPGGGRG